MSKKPDINRFHAKRIKKQIGKKRQRLEELELVLKQKEQLIAEQAKKIKELEDKLARIESEESLHWQPTE